MSETKVLTTYSLLVFIAKSVIIITVLCGTPTDLLGGVQKHRLSGENGFLRWFTGHLQCSHRVSTLTPDTWPYDAAVYGRLGLGAQPARDIEAGGEPPFMCRGPPEGTGRARVHDPKGLTLVPPGGEASLAEGQSSILPSPPPSGLGSGVLRRKLDG